MSLGTKDAVSQPLCQEGPVCGHVCSMSSIEVGEKVPSALSL